MSWLSLLAWGAAGLAGGAAVGWVLGRRLRATVPGLVAAFLVPFAAGSWAAWRAMARGDRPATIAWLCFIFGAMTAAKYASGIIGLGMEKLSAPED